jgi:type III restriction enzyme
VRLSLLVKNIQAVQLRNNIKVLNEEDIIKNGWNFSVEMETGTGKTYTYIRTIYELNKTYGFKKFVIVVPSVAIREGVVKNLEITNSHFQSLYENPPINFIMYDSRNVSTLRNFASSNAIQVLVINIDSFAKDTNVINTVRETGIKPIEYLQVTRPFVIVDEPQNMETDIRKAAIENLSPLCTLRYSATHKYPYNLLYSLSPVQAYDRGLVKQIEVDGITTEGNYNAAYIQLKGIQQGKRSIKAKLSIYRNEGGAVQQKDITVDLGEDLFELSGGRDMYKDGFILNEINGKEQYVVFSNGTMLETGQTQGGLTDEIMKFQVERTVQHHFEKVKNLKAKGIKVLSLFFIDKVANYREYNEDGTTGKGKFALWFEEAFDKYNKIYKGIIPNTASEVHNGYFSGDKKGTGKDKREEWTDTKGTTAKDEDTYSLIMRDKEKLLGMDEPLQFIFSHSALREGWDNPNVFQICTLNESKSEMKKRQEIGRGLRLPVDSTGQRVQDKRTNVLTVIANETYEAFSEALQKEIEDETGIEFKNRIKDVREKKSVRLTKELNIENFPLFFEIWERIKHKTRYQVSYSTDKLIEETTKALKQKNVSRPLIKSETGSLSISDHGIEGKRTHSTQTFASNTKYLLPDVYAYVQGKVDVTKKTIFAVIKASERQKDLEINPQMFLDQIVEALRSTLHMLMIDGIKYETISGAFYEMKLFADEELETYLSGLFEVTKNDKTLFNYITIDGNSGIERNFAAQCETDESVKFFFKMPKGFKIPTPIGNYIPDWAVVFENDKRIYFVTETKSTLSEENRRGVENLKIQCGKKHFALFAPQGVKYIEATELKDLYKASE